MTPACPAEQSGRAGSTAPGAAVLLGAARHMAEARQ